MTSKRLLWARWLEMIKRSSWLWQLNILFFVLYKTYKNIFSMITRNYYEIKYNNSIMGEYIFSMGSLFWIIVLAMIAGTQGFSYLHSKNKVNMYHSQPISERSRFLWIYLNGLLCFVIPRIIGCILEAAAVFFYMEKCTPKKTLFGNIFLQIYCETILEILLYFAIYQIAVLMTILTSYILFSVIGTITALFYETFIRKLIDGFSENFFHTYYEKSGEEIRQCKVSVLHLFEQMRGRICTGMSGAEMLKEIIYSGSWIIILSMIIAVLAYIAYRKRPLENVKMPFVFPWIRAVSKGMIIVPGILCSIHLTEFETDKEGRQVLFRIIYLLLSAFVIHCVIEVIFEKDLKAVYKHKKSAIVSTGIAAGILMIFQFDVAGYNRYIPKEKEIESIGIVPYEKEGYGDVQEDIKLYEFSEGILDEERESYILEHMKLSSIEELCALAKENCKYTWEQAVEELEKDKYTTLQQTIFAFHMKNGKTIYRNYYIVSQKEDNPLKRIQQSMEYIQGNGMWLHNEEYMDYDKEATEERLYSVLWVDTEKNERKLSYVGTKTADKMRDILKKDVEENGSQVKQGEKLLGKIVIFDEVNYEYEEEYMIYPQYRETIAYLKTLKVEME